MLDFVNFSARFTKQDSVEIFPYFETMRSTDLMIRGNDFFAIWDEEKGLWSTDMFDAVRLIDKEMDIYVEKHKEEYGDRRIKRMYLKYSNLKSIDDWVKYCKKQAFDNWHALNQKIIFSNTETTKESYASKKLKYAMKEEDISAYDELMNTLYEKEERWKLEWSICCIIAGDIKEYQKFTVLYGPSGAGKGTVLKIIKKLFDGYCVAFHAKSLTSNNNNFPLEQFRSEPLVAIDEDGDLSRIEDNTLLNSLVSGEDVVMNVKHLSTYQSQFNCYLFMGTNKPVKITDAKSGIIRRLIDVSPSGRKLPHTKYNALLNKIDFELGGIAYHCLEVYKSNPTKYDNYIPINMIGATNDFYNFVLDQYEFFSEENGITLNAAWEEYKKYCDRAKVLYPMSQRVFKEELKSYFRNFYERTYLEDGTRVRNYFSGFDFEKYQNLNSIEVETGSEKIDFILTDHEHSLFDDQFADCPAQYANSSETPISKWADVETTLKDISTKELHYVKVPENLIVIDFDIKDLKGNKVYELNAAEAQKWPATYAELSKGGEGIHLHYIYNGDVSLLSRIYKPGIEIKVFSGNSSLRRKLTKCNDIPIRTITSGLPFRKEKVSTFEGVKNEKALRTLIKKNLRKEIHGATKPSVDFIFKILEDAYNSDLKYDVSDMKSAVINFAMDSTNNAEYCLKLVGKMKFKSEEPTEERDYLIDKLIFFDCEVAPNFFGLCWHMEGDEWEFEKDEYGYYKAKLVKPGDYKMVKMKNPTSQDIEDLLKYKLVGFNCRRYDNHILHARLMGYSNKQLAALSARIIGKVPDSMFSEAYNYSYVDVLDMAAASRKQSLKKYEYQLDIDHQEMNVDWSKDIPEERWDEVLNYCANDVMATEATFYFLKGDWKARQILADIAGMTPNDTTNSLTTRIIFGKEKHPKLIYTHLDTGEQE